MRNKLWCVATLGLGLEEPDRRWFIHILLFSFHFKMAFNLRDCKCAGTTIDDGPFPINGICSCGIKSAGKRMLSMWWASLNMGILVIEKWTVIAFKFGSLENCYWIGACNVAAATASGCESKYELRFLLCDEFFGKVFHFAIRFGMWSLFFVVVYIQF